MGFKRRVVDVSYVCTTFAGHHVMGLLAKLFETRACNLALTSLSYSTCAIEMFVRLEYFTVHSAY
jgi:hypothetical protein